ncbi:MAG TPA: 50S ribosomal protein L35 [Patescibacteria group bacterium]|nr:50S ribosomal protein L35 [Patescibacteria group bacterium]
MPKIKQKTRKTIAKRVRRTKKGKGKLTMRKAGQGHFNSRESGKTVRNKRKDLSVHNTLAKNIKRVA